MTIAVHPEAFADLVSILSLRELKMYKARAVRNQLLILAMTMTSEIEQRVCGIKTRKQV